MGISARLTGIPARLTEAARWRYRVHLWPHVMVHRSPLRVVRRWWNNRCALSATHRIAYIYADPTNSGDHASHLGVKKLVGLPGFELFCAPTATKATFGLLRRVALSDNPWRGVFVGGGGLLQQCFEGFWERLLESGAQNLVLFGVGAAEQLPERRLLQSGLLSHIADRAIAIHVRDRFTRDLIAAIAPRPVSMGICPSACVVADFTAKLKCETTHLLHVIHEADLTIAGVSIPALQDHVRRLASSIGLIYDETHHLVGFNRKLLAKYARAAIVVSSRLHGCIFSYAMDKPFIAIACDKKISEFVHSHVPAAPLVGAAQYSAQLTADLVKHSVIAPRNTGLKEAVEATARRMSEILTLLELNG